MTQQPGSNDADSHLSEQSDTASEEYGGPNSRTPLYRASNAPRYQRQDIISRIQERTGRRLICYVSGNHCAIDWDDTRPFGDLLHNVKAGEDVDLLLHTLGGNADAAEKLTRLVRQKVDESEFRIVVPEMAKSAGTLMVLGTDRVVMSDTSELGPIDPQYTVAGSKVRIPHSVQHYLDAYEEYYDALQANPNDVAANIMLNKLDPATVKLFQAIMARARQSAQHLLTNGMFRSGGPWTVTAEALLDTDRWLSHSQMISWEDARDPNVGLVVEYFPQDDGLWQDYWQLYCHQRLAITDTQKLFESDFVSLTVEANVP